MNFLKKFFQTQESKQSFEEFDVGKYNGFTLFFDEKNEPNIKLNITKTSKEDAEAFATGMFLLSKGAYVISTLDLLGEMSKNDDIIGDFRKNTMIHWYSLLTEYNKTEQQISNDPIVSPTKFTGTIDKHE